MLVGGKLDLAAAVCAAHPRAADRHASATERHLTALVAVTHRRALAVGATLRAHDLVDLGFHELVQHPETNTDAERQQALLRGARELTERLTHTLRQLIHALLAGHDRPSRYGPHSGRSSCPRWTWFRTHHGPKRTGRGGRTAVFNFYGLRDNLRHRVEGEIDRRLHLLHGRHHMESSSRARRAARHRV